MANNCTDKGLLHRERIGHEAGKIGNKVGGWVEGALAKIGIVFESGGNWLSKLKNGVGDLLMCGPRYVGGLLGLGQGDKAAKAAKGPGMLEKMGDWFKGLGKGAEKAAKKGKGGEGIGHFVKGNWGKIAIGAAVLGGGAMLLGGGEKAQNNDMAPGAPAGPSPQISDSQYMGQMQQMQLQRQ